MVWFVELQCNSKHTIAPSVAGSQLINAYVEIEKKGIFVQNTILGSIVDIATLPSHNK